MERFQVAAGDLTDCKMDSAKATSMQGVSVKRFCVKQCEGNGSCVSHVDYSVMH